MSLLQRLALHQDGVEFHRELLVTSGLVCLQSVMGSCVTLLKVGLNAIIIQSAQLLDCNRLIRLVILTDLILKLYNYITHAVILDDTSKTEQGQTRFPSKSFPFRSNWTLKQKDSMDQQLFLKTLTQKIGQEYFVFPIPHESE